MITAAISNSFKLALAESVLGDQFKIALYSSTANLNTDTSEYTTEGEVSGQGYTAGGMDLEGIIAQADAKPPFLTGQSTQNGPMQPSPGALIYNATQGNKAVGVLDAGNQDRVVLKMIELECSACHATKPGCCFAPSQVRKPHGRVCISCTRERRRKGQRGTLPKGEGFRRSAVYFGGKVR
jgi:hypothetical protein